MSTIKDLVAGRQLIDLQVVKPLQEKLKDFLQKLQRLIYISTSHKVDSYDFMDPELWQNLPREMVVFILASLPVCKLTRLRCHLSKEWTMSIEFNQACERKNPNMAALISHPLANNEFLVRIFNFNKFEWLYEYRFCLVHREYAPKKILLFWKPVASDGGLVCFVSINKYTSANPLCIVVINPLTRVQHQLPLLQHVYTTPPILVYMKVDSKTKEYKVVVVKGKKRDRHSIETYDSISRQWSISVPSYGHIWGRACEYKSNHCNYFRLKRSHLCTFDFKQRQLDLLDCDSLFHCEGASVVQHALAGNRIFVLHKKLNQDRNGSGIYFITEYHQSRNNAKVWVPMKTHNKCFPKEEDKLFDIHACEDVVVLRDRFSSKNEICRIMNFSTNEWHNLVGNSLEVLYVSLMCRVFWDATP